MKRTGIIIFILVFASLALPACKAKEEYVKLDQKNFPDTELYNVVLNFDLDQDSKLRRSEVESATSVSLSRVEDLTGLEIFTNLETIYIREGNNLNCDFKNFTNLRTLCVVGSCDSNRIDLSGNTMIESIYIDSENLEDLVLPEGAPLKEISIGSTLLKSIDVSSYKELTKIQIDGNELITELAFCDIPELAELTCSSNTKLGSLTVSNCPKLKILECTSNDLTNLNISGCENIEEFICRENKSLKSLDLSAFPKLKVLDCSYNDLSGIDVSCCTELTELNCVENRLTSLEFSSIPDLKSLCCGANPFKELDVSCCPNLETLSCYSCELTSLNFTGCSNINLLVCDDNELTSLDVTGCPKLTGLYCTENNLTSLDISKCPELVDLIINSAEPNEHKDGESVIYHDGRALDIDKEIDLVIPE